MSNKQNDELVDVITDWVPLNSRDELVRACNELDVMRPLAEAACDYIHNVEAGHHGPNGKATKNSLISLHAAVNMYQEWEQDA